MLDFIKKGDDNSYICKSFGGKTSVEHYFNEGSFSPYHLLKSNPTVGLSEALVKENDGTMKCSFTRQNKIPEVANYFELPGQYNVLLAYGPIVNGKIKYHSFRTASNEKLNF